MVGVYHGSRALRMPGRTFTNRQAVNDEPSEHRLAPDHAPTTFFDVLVVRRSDAGWFCEISDRPVFVGQLQLAPGTSVPSEGQRGAITLTAQGAEEVRRTIGAALMKRNLRPS
jgi:hypothetical protein